MQTRMDDSRWAGTEAVPDSGEGDINEETRQDVCLPEVEDSDMNTASFKDGARDTKVAIIGNVDSGKSTLVGVLTQGALDDGRGKARSKVFNFSHEAANGRTSSVAHELMGFKDSGEQVLMERPSAASATSKNTAWQHIVSSSERLVTFIDLCGHEKYLKTTIFGLIGLCPDHAMIVVNANAGFQRMSREHLGIALALSIPITLVITKVDLAPQNVFAENLASLCKMLKSNAVKKKPVVVETAEDMQAAIHGQCRNDICPIFCVSNVTGEGLDNLRHFVRNIHSRVHISGLFRSPTDPAEFHLDGVFSVTGVGTVVSGIMRSGRITTNQQLLLGPDAAGQFKPVLVKTIHFKRVPTQAVESGQAAAVSIRSLVKKDVLKKTSFRKGMVLVDAGLQPLATTTFKAEVVILHHATTIRMGYQAVVHCGIVRASATVTHLSTELLRTGDKAIVTFRFMRHAEYLVPGSTILFREGRTRGLGTVVECVDDSQQAGE